MLRGVEGTMQNYLTPEEAAQHLRVEPSEILALVEQGKMRAILIGTTIRIPEAEFDRLSVTCSASPLVEEIRSQPSEDAAPANWRVCATRNGTPFRVAGSVATGADIWPGKKANYPIRFPKWFMETMLSHFASEEVAVGGSFDAPSPGSIGEFIQQQLKIKMNPAVYVVGLLIEEGYAEASRRGYIRFRSKRTSTP
jgi:excisionase family DNA binding protein